MSKRLEQQSGAYWDEHNLGAPADVTYWLAVPELRSKVNSLLSGDPDKLYIQSFVESFRDRWPVTRALSVGCGAGELERGIASQGVATSVDGVDVSRASLTEAKRLANQEDLEEVITYAYSAAHEWLADTTRTYDLIFFHGVLHHLQDLECIFQLAGDRIRGGNPGLIYIDEYVGPSRAQWTEDHLRWPEKFFVHVAPEDRRTPHVWPPIAMEDPTEMIRSSEIVELAYKHLSVVDCSPYYGNIVFPLVNAIKASRLHKYTKLLLDAWQREQQLVETGELKAPHYMALVARR